MNRSRTNIREAPNGDLSANIIAGYRRGWAFTPLAGKRPLLRDWTTRPRATLKKVLDWAQRHNLGLRTGRVSDGIIVVDVDAGADLARLGLPETVTAVTGGGGRHYYYRYNGTVGNSTGLLGKHVDVKADGGQVVFPGSRHPDSGKKYHWLRGHAPGEIEIAELPRTILKKLRAPRQRVRVESNGNGAPIREGERNQHLASMAGALRARGSDQDVIETALLAENQSRCLPPLSDREVAAIAKSFARYPAGDRQFPLTDTGLAERFAQQHGEDVRYCHPWGKWLAWDGTRWQMDDAGAVDRLAKQTVRTIIKEAMAEEDVEKRKAILSFARNAESAARREAMIRLARSEPPIPILPDALDSNAWLLNCPNGTLDLRTGKLRRHCRGDYITKLCPVEYDPDALCSIWRAFLKRIVPPAELRRFMRRAVGMSFTGDVREHVLFFLYGVGANGKSTFLNTIQRILGSDYAMKAPPELLMQKRSETHPTERADLKGKRLVCCIETSEGRQLAETMVKELTGGDIIRARRMREDFWQFMPTHKIWLAGNHKPVIRGTDYAIWRRIKLVPFTVTIPEPEQDKELPTKLIAESAGILGWAVGGCLKWQQEGLGEPEAVRNATAAYRSEMDVLGAFVAEQCNVEADCVEGATALYTQYKEWAEAAGERVITQTAFAGALTERGFTNSQYTRGAAKGRRKWLGIELKPMIRTYKGE